MEPGAHGALSTLRLPCARVPDTKPRSFCCCGGPYQLPALTASDPQTHSPCPQVESIILSIISMLSSPNDESPANIDAAKDWRENRPEFKKKVSRIVRKSQESL